jgi:hypothetical protein
MTNIVKPHNNNRVQMTVSIDRAELETVKQLAIWENSNVSRLVGAMIRAKLAETKRTQ